MTGQAERVRPGGPGRRMRALVVGILLVAGWGAGAAVQAQEVRVDSSEVVVRMPEAAALAEAVNDPAYRYDLEPSPSLWSRFGSWVRRWFGRLFGSSTLRPFWRILPYVVFVAALVVVIIQLLKTDLRSIVAGRETPVGPFELADEDLEAMDLNALLNDAVASHRYREAVRYSYLAVLKRLTEHGLIHWRREKTNRDYVHELGASPLRPAFERLTRLFEYVWYGENEVDEATFRDVRASFKAFQQAVREAAPQPAGRVRTTDPVAGPVG